MQFVFEQISKNSDPYVIFLFLFLKEYQLHFFYLFPQDKSLPSMRLIYIHSLDHEHVEQRDGHQDLRV